MKWHECPSCMAEFRVVSDTDSPIEFCPFCGSDVEDEEEEEEFEEDLDYDED